MAYAYHPASNEITMRLMGRQIGESNKAERKLFYTRF